MDDLSMNSSIYYDHIILYIEKIIHLLRIIYRKLIHLLWLSGWWWLEHDFTCPFRWEFHHPISSQLTFIFFRGVETTNQDTHQELIVGFSVAMFVQQRPTAYKAHQEASRSSQFLVSLILLIDNDNDDHDYHDICINMYIYI